MGKHRKLNKRQYASRPLRPNPPNFYVQRQKQPVALFTVYSNGERIYIRQYKKGDEQCDDFYIRKSDPQGRISIPSELKEGRLKTSPLEVTIVDETTYILEPVKYKTCILCGASEQDEVLVKVVDNLVCLPCLKKLCAEGEAKANSSDSLTN